MVQEPKNAEAFGLEAALRGMIVALDTVLRRPRELSRKGAIQADRLIPERMAFSAKTGWLQRGVVPLEQGLQARQLALPESLHLNRRAPNRRYYLAWAAHTRHSHQN